MTESKLLSLLPDLRQPEQRPDGWLTLKEIVAERGADEGYWGGRLSNDKAIEKREFAVDVGGGKIRPVMCYRVK